MLKLNHLTRDIFASAVIFLIGIPICVGIAIASNAPVCAGFLSGIVGAIVVGSLSESRVSVSGPSAGMVAIVIAAANTLGSFEAYLLALMFAGLLQMLAGFLRAGFIANFIPTSVIQGLLAAIGTIIIIKQIPLVLGYVNENGSLELSSWFSLLQGDSHVWSYVWHAMHPGSIIIAGIALSILIFWRKIPVRKLRMIPPAFIIVILSVIINDCFYQYFPNLNLSEGYLVYIPLTHHFSSFISHLQYPDFSFVFNENVYIYALMIAMIASLETLLNIEAIEKLDPKHHYISRNRELFAQGMGNFVLGLCGGLPVTSVIVRSSINIDAGARSKLSTILQGFLLLFSLTFIAKWLNQIPIAALAAILMHTGYKFTRLTLFRDLYHEGLSNFVPFVVTFVAILVTNLLLGIIVGLIVSIFFVFHYNGQQCFTMLTEERATGTIIRLILPQQVSFLHKSAMVAHLNQLPNGTTVIIDGKLTSYIDKEILNVIKQFNELQAERREIILSLEGIPEQRALQPNSRSASVTTSAIHSQLTPEMVYQLLRAGNYRFRQGVPINNLHHQHVACTANAKHPMAVILSCMDARVPTEAIFDLHLGDVFVLRIAANIVNREVLASIELACHSAGAKLIVILGHTDCATIKMACEPEHIAIHKPLAHKLESAVNWVKAQQPELVTDSDRFSHAVTQCHVQLTKQSLYEQSNVLQSLVRDGQVRIIGAIYDVATGKVEFERAYKKNPA